MNSLIVLAGMLFGFVHGGFRVEQKLLAADLQAVKGKWAYLLVEKKNAMRYVEIGISGDTFEVKLDEESKGRFRLDVTTIPRQVTITIHDGPSQGKVFKGIYRFVAQPAVDSAGKPSSRMWIDLIIAQPSDPRPKDFTTELGKSLRLVLFPSKD